MIHFLHSYITNINFCVKLDNVHFEEREVIAGVPQGSFIGPAVLSLYINDVPTTPEVYIAIYADDTALYIHIIGKRLPNHPETK